MYVNNIGTCVEFSEEFKISLPKFRWNDFMENCVWLSHLNLKHKLNFKVVRVGHQVQHFVGLVALLRNLLLIISFQDINECNRKKFVMSSDLTIHSENRKIERNHSSFNSNLECYLMLIWSANVRICTIESVGKSKKYTLFMHFLHKLGPEVSFSSKVIKWDNSVYKYKICHENRKSLK